VRRLDTLLVERGYQPIATSLAAWWSPYDIGAFLGAGFLVVHSAEEMKSVAAGKSLFLSFISEAGSLFLTWMLVAASQRAARHADSGRQTINPERTRYLSFRVFLFLQMTVLLLTDLIGLLPPDLFDLATLLLMTGHYFVACEHHPPLQLNPFKAVEAA
jgi:hypothetical protein